jgi:type IV pilus assembly protein PilQ
MITATGGANVVGSTTTTGINTGYTLGTQTPAVAFPASDPSGGATVPAGVTLALSDVAGTLRLNMRLSALENDGRSKTLSNPKLTTINGVKAKIESGREIPYQQSAGGTGGTTVSFKNAVISLEVTPFVTPDNMINMKIVAKKDDADFTNQVLGVPSILTRTINTNVLVLDGGTAVLGGVFENQKSINDKGVPWLSKIPVLGWLFKSNDKMDNEKELLIFITPRIVKGNFS